MKKGPPVERPEDLITLRTNLVLLCFLTNQNGDVVDGVGFVVRVLVER